jgi:hypothetical protein
LPLLFFCGILFFLFCYSGDCCTPSVTVSVVDIGGHIAQCHLELSDGNPVESVESAAEVVTTPEETTQDETTPVATSHDETTPVVTTQDETTPVVTTQDETTPVVTTPAVTPVIVSIFVILFTFNERT